MQDSRTHILYIAEYSTGGSVESLLCLVGGLDKKVFKATVLFARMPDSAICDRFESGGASVLSLYPRSSNVGAPKQLQKLNMQSRVRAVLGQRVESVYESLKFAIHFFRFRLPVQKAILRKIDQVLPDLIHLNNGIVGDMAGIRAASARHIPAVCHIRNFRKLPKLSVATSRSVSVFICISRAVREHLIKAGVAPDRCVVVPNAVNPVRFNEAAISTAGLREEFGWNESHKLFALVGRLVSWKGQDYFLKAIATARKTDTSVRGLIVGDGEATSGSDAYVGRLKTLASELNLDEFVTFTGHRTDVPNIMKSVDGVICASSDPEPFGRVIIESMAVGTPAIATNAGGAADIIADGVDGLLVPIKDSDALAEAILRVSGDDAFAREMREAAMRTVADRYTEKQHVARVRDVYRTILDSQQKDSSR